MIDRLEAAERKIAARDRLLRQRGGRIDALAAHVERLSNALSDMMTEFPTGDFNCEKRAIEAGYKALADTPETSLARLKAQWQAEALHEEANLLEAAPQLTPYHRIDAKAVAKVLRERAELRRQAKENNHETNET